MKNTILTLLFAGVVSLAFGQDRMPINNDMNNRTAAKDMNNTITPPALPVMNTFIPPEVMSRTTGSYGKGLYAITQLKSAMGENAYQVTLIDNGQAKYEWVNESGAAVATVFRTPETDSIYASTHNNMNGNNGTNTGMQSSTNNSGTNTTANNNGTAMDSTTNTMNNNTNNTGLNGDSSMNQMQRNNMNNSNNNMMNNNSNSNNPTTSKAGLKRDNNNSGTNKNWTSKGTMNMPAENNGTKATKANKSTPSKPKEQ